MNPIISALRSLSIYDLEQLAGPTIVKAVRGAYETNRERALAQLVIDRFGANLLKNKDIRCEILMENEIGKLIKVSPKKQNCLTQIHVINL